MKAHYNVVVTYEDGGKTILATTRRLNGALNELDLHVASKRKQLMTKKREGQRIIEGPDITKENEEAATCVIFMGPNVYAVYRFSIERILALNE